MKKGTIIGGRFELLSGAAQGGMGSVYRGSDHATSNTVAVKILTVTPTGSGQAAPQAFNLVRFGREAAMLATVKHPNVVGYVSHGESDGMHYLVQEWVEGVTLGAQLHTTGATASEAVKTAIGVAAALEATHALGVIHRDIKPSNIILVEGDPDRVKLVDFGIARMANEAGVLTRTGMMIGTPSYMAPEQAQGLVQLEATADVWALGCVLYEALSGRQAFAGKTPTAIRTKVLLGETLSLAAACPEAPPELLALVRDMLEKSPDRRPANGAEVLVRLRALPPIPEGPRRRVGVAEPKTQVSLTPRSGAANCFVFMTPVEPERTSPDYDEKLARVAARHNLKVHPFEDGSTLLAAKETGKLGALAAASAALELREEVFDGAVSVFGQAFTDTLSEAIDRGSMLLERAVMSNLFDGDAIGSGDLIVHIDEVIASLVDDELAVSKRPDGPVLQARSSTRQ